MLDWDTGCMALVGLVLLFGLSIGLVLVLLPIIFNYWAVILKVILIVFFYCIFGVILYGIIECIKNGEGIGVTICLALALVWGYVGYVVWKNVPRTTSQADNSASPKAQLAAEKSAREQSEVAKAEEERKRKEAEQVLKKEQTSIARQSIARKYKVGDKITFGSYPFYADGRKKAIDWIILDIDKKGNALVISDYALDNVKYNEKYVTITWEDSSIRKWLNNEFLNKAFSPEQRRKIISSRIANKDNAKYNTWGGDATTDKLFLLSIDEARRYFKSNDDRKAYRTPYANLKEKDSTACWWWLRSPSGDLKYAANVNTDGNVDSYGNVVGDVYYSHAGYVLSGFLAVRPAFKINLKNIEADGHQNAEEAKKKKEERKARKLAAQQAAAAKAAARQYKVGDKIYNVGNIITFGSYPFYADGSKKAIDWKILDIDENGDALVISDYALDNVKYNKRNRAITWEDSSIRKWLNKTFINKAFTAEQRSKIINSHIANNATTDKMFLLSIEEAEKYFKDDESRIAYPTPYAKSKESVNGNLWVSSSYVSTDRGGSCWWWLRSPGLQGLAAGVGDFGFVRAYGYGVDDEDGGVRAALKINLNNL